MSEEETAALKTLLREIVTWLGQQQGRKGVWYAAVDDFREKARPFLSPAKKEEGTQDLLSRISREGGSDMDRERRTPQPSAEKWFGGDWDTLQPRDPKTTKLQPQPSDVCGREGCGLPRWKHETSTFEASSVHAFEEPPK